MKITALRSTELPRQSIDDAVRNLFYTEFNNVSLTGRNLHYPNCLIKYESSLVNPYDERVMSLNKDSFYDNNEWNDVQITGTLDTYNSPVFFFIYNTDNYYHFIYDSLPILYTFFELKKNYPNIQLLINTSHPSKKNFAPFVLEFLNSLGITNVLYPKQDILYSKFFVSTSFTHGGESNKPPADKSYLVWNSLKTLVTTELPRKFYISRRSWVHGKTDNLGTNYTLRRKCINEDNLVELLEKYGVKEVFTELLTTSEKITLFANAELVVGIIGGGMANLLFSPKKTKSLCIATPYFLDINYRFRFSMDHTQILYSNSTQHINPDTTFLLYSRVKVIDTSSKYYGCIGEVEEIHGGQYLIRISSNDVAGFSQDFPMELIEFNETNLQAVDKGLNSPFSCDLVKLEDDLKKLLKE